MHKNINAARNPVDSLLYTRNHQSMSIIYNNFNIQVSLSRYNHQIRGILGVSAALRRISPPNRQLEGKVFFWEEQLERDIATGQVIFW